jgi:hypothetical protein
VNFAAISLSPSGALWSGILLGHQRLTSTA